MKKEIKPYYRYYASRLVSSIGPFSKVANLKNSYTSMHLSLERGNYSRFLATLLPAVSSFLTDCNSIYKCGSRGTARAVKSVRWSIE